MVIWDNLKPHKAKAVVGAIEDAGARLIPIPPWSSDMTPIEERFSKVKGALRSVAARTTETATAAIGSALHEISARHLEVVPPASGVRNANVNRSRVVTDSPAIQPLPRPAGGLLQAVLVAS